MRLDTAFNRRAPRILIPRVVKFPVLLSLLFSSITGFVTVVAYQNLQPIIPIWYSLTQLEDQLANKMWLFTLPVVALSLTIVHIFILRYVLKNEETVMQLFAWMTVIMTGLLMLCLIRIVLIV
jgi:hypothetical protein